MKIVSIKKANVMHALDIGIEGPNYTYLLHNGVISHNSMKGILEDYNETAQEPVPLIVRREAPEREERLPCDIWDLRADGKRYICLVGKQRGQLFEIFVTQDPRGNIDLEKHKKGIIRKVKSDYYDLIVVENGEEKVLIENIGELFNKLDLGLSRAISLDLRFGIPLPEIVKFLTKSQNIAGFKFALSRVLKQYIKDGEKVVGEKCPQCGAALEYKTNCKSCPQCLWSIC